MTAPTDTQRLSEVYLSQCEGTPDPSALAFYAMLDTIASSAPTIAQGIARELRDQRENLKLIASENYSSLAVQYAQGNLLTDKYAEGFPFHRFYAGCDNVDAIEDEADQLACSLFGAEHAYMQPHSGADANLVAFLAILSARVEHPILSRLGEENPAKLERSDWDAVRQATFNQRLLALDYYSGGHLTHGYRHNVSGRLFDAYTYSVEKDTSLLDLDRVRTLAREIKPLILLAGYSAYSRKINFAEMRSIADEVGAVLMVDMAHFAGLVAGKVFTDDFDPVRWAQVVTTTTHKTLRGPRGGMVLCTSEFAEAVDKGCPAVLGGPLPHVMAAKAVALREASRADFGEYAHQIVRNAQALAAACQDEGMHVLTGGTDNHLLLVDVAQSFDITGRQAESALRECGITLNRNALPFDGNGPWYTSGLRIGTPAITTLGMNDSDMSEIAKAIRTALESTHRGQTKSGGTSKSAYVVPPDAVAKVRDHVTHLLASYPVYPQLSLSLLQRLF